jgi:hypothetical protein
MPKTSKMKKKKGKLQEIKVDSNAVKTLRSLGNEEAFYFYEALDKPTGQSAKSLQEFLEKMESIKPESLIFHHGRNDFKNWIANTLEDPELAKKIEKIPAKNEKQLRTKICATIKAHLQELEANPTVQVDVPLTVAA